MIDFSDFDKIGEIHIHSGHLIVIDPGYDPETAAIPGFAFTKKCTVGCWVAYQKEVGPKEAPSFRYAESVLLLSDEALGSDELVWKNESRVLGSDHGVMSLLDRDLFLNDETRSAIYENICHTLPGTCTAYVTQSLNFRWDGGIRVAFAGRDKVVAARLDIDVTPPWMEQFKN